MKNTEADIVFRATSNTSFLANNVSFYKTLGGTVSQPNNSNTITGVGTSFAEDFRAGQSIHYTTGGYNIRIHSISNNTIMTGVARPANTVSASLYGIRVPDSPVKGLIPTEIWWSGTWLVKRGGNTLCSLSGSDHWELGDAELPLAEYKGASLVFQTPNGQTGTILVRAKKTY